MYKNETIVVKNNTPDVFIRGRKVKSNSVYLRIDTIISSNNSADTATTKNGNSRLTKYEYILYYPQVACSTKITTDKIICNDFFASRTDWVNTLKLCFVRH